jgi:phage-related protein
MNSYSIIVLAIIIPFLFLLTLQNKKIEHFDFFSDIKNTITGWVNNSIVDPVKNASSSISNLAVNIGNKVLDGGSTFIGSISDGVMEVKDKFLNIFNGLGKKLVEFLKRLKNGLSSFMGSKLETVRKFIEDRVKDIVSIKDYIFNEIKKIWETFEKKIMQSLQYVFYGLLALNGISLFGCLFNLLQYFFPRGCPNCSCQSC